MRAERDDPYDHSTECIAEDSQEGEDDDEGRWTVRPVMWNTAVEEEVEERHSAYDNAKGPPRPPGPGMTNTRMFARISPSEPTSRSCPVVRSDMRLSFRAERQTIRICLPHCVALRRVSPNMCPAVMGSVSQDLS